MCWHRRVRISTSGSLRADEWQTSNRPPLDALMVHWHQDLPIPAHASISWGLAEFARQRHDLIAPPGWDKGRLAPHRLASNLSVELVRAIDEMIPELRLPNASERDLLYESVVNPLWFEQQGSLAVYPRGQQRQAVLMLTP